MSLRFASITNDNSKIPSDFIGLTLSIFYICIFLYYSNTKERRDARFQIGYAIAFLISVFAYTLIEDPTRLPTRYGLIFGIVNLLPFNSLVSFYKQVKCFFP